RRLFPDRHLRYSIVVSSDAPRCRARAGRVRSDPACLHRRLRVAGAHHTLTDGRAGRRVHRSRRLAAAAAGDLGGDSLRRLGLVLQRRKTAHKERDMNRRDNEGTNPITVDVVIPVLNEAHVLEKSVRTVRGFLNQHFTTYEWSILIVDNGSTDGTDQVALKLSAQFPD